MPIAENEFQEEPAILRALDRIQQAKGHILLETLRAHCVNENPNLVPAFNQHLFTAILTAADIPSIKSVPFATLHQLYIYAHFIHSNNLWSAIGKVAPLVPPKIRACSQLLRLEQLLQKQPERPGNMRRAYLDRALDKFKHHLLSESVAQVKPLHEYLDELEREFPSALYFDQQPAIPYLKEMARQFIVAHFGNVHNQINAADVGNYPNNRRFHKIKTCLRQEGWDDGLQIKLSLYDNESGLALEAARYLANRIKQLDTIEQRNEPIIARSYDKLLQSNVVRTLGDHIHYQQDCYFSEVLPQNDQDPNNFVTQLTTLSDHDRRLLLWNLGLKLQEKYGNREAAFVPSHNKYTGSTANVALAIDNKVYIANIGDSECYVVIRKKDGTTVAKRHHPLDNLETRERIRVGNGTIGMSRSIGDCDKEAGGLLHHPHVISVDVDIEEGDIALLLQFSDGVRGSYPADFDLDAHLANSVAEVCQHLPNAPNRDETIAKVIIQSAINNAPKGKMDNTTVVVQTIGLGSKSLSAVFDGHGGLDRAKIHDISGERLVSKRLQAGLKQTFAEVLEDAYIAKRAFPDKPIPAAKTALGHFELEPESAQTPAATPPKLNVWKNNLEVLKAQQQREQFPNYTQHLSHAHPILSDQCVSWTITPQCVDENNPFDMPQESRQQFATRLNRVKQQVGALCQDQKPDFVLLQVTNPLNEFKLPAPYKKQGRAPFVSIYNADSYTLIEADSNKAQKDYQDFIHDSEDSEQNGHVMILENNQSKQRILVANLNLMSETDLALRLNALNQLKQDHRCTTIKIAGNFSRELNQLQINQQLNELHWQQKQAANASSYRVNQEIVSVTEMGMIQDSPVADFTVLTQYNTTAAPDQRESATLAGPSVNCVNSPEKIQLFQAVWQQIQNDLSEQKQPANFSPLLKSNYQHETSVCGKVNHKNIYQTNKGITHIESVDNSSAYAALRLHLASQLMLETTSASGECSVEILQPDKNPKGLLLYPKTHPRAGKLISIIIFDCPSKESEKLLLDAAKRLGLTVEGAPSMTSTRTKEKAEDEKMDVDTPGNPMIPPTTPMETRM